MNLSEATAADGGVRIRVNGHPHRLPVDENTPLLLALRNDLGLKAAKLGCALEQCRACTVLVDGTARTSCTTRVADVASADVTTLEGLADQERFATLRHAFLEEQVLRGAGDRDGPAGPARPAVPRRR